MKNSKSQYYQIPNKSQLPNPNIEKEKIYDIRERTFSFAQRVLEIAEKLPQNRVCDVLRTQVVKSGTSIGANVEEADGTVTKRDFANKIAIARNKSQCQILPKSPVNPNFQIPKRKDKQKGGAKLVVLVCIGIWDLFGSIGIY